MKKLKVIIGAFVMGLSTAQAQNEYRNNSYQYGNEDRAGEARYHELSAMDSTPSVNFGKGKLGSLRACLSSQMQNLSKTTSGLSQSERPLKQRLDLARKDLSEQGQFIKHLTEILESIDGKQHNPTAEINECTSKIANISWVRMAVPKAIKEASALFQATQKLDLKSMEQVSSFTKRLERNEKLVADIFFYSRPYQGELSISEVQCSLSTARDIH